MHNNPDSWIAVSFLEKNKATQHNFEFQIQYGPDGRSDAIFYMTAQMKHNLIRYGHVLYIKMHKKTIQQSWMATYRHCGYK